MEKSLILPFVPINLYTVNFSDVNLEPKICCDMIRTANRVMEYFRK